jgi:hypothetical protein
MDLALGPLPNVLLATHLPSLSLSLLPHHFTYLVPCPMSFSPSSPDLERVDHTPHSNFNRTYNRQQTYYHHHYHHLDRATTIKRGIEKLTEEIVYRPHLHPGPYIHPSRRMVSGDDGYIRPESRKGPYDTDSSGGSGNRLNPKARSFFVSPT